MDTIAEFWVLPPEYKQVRSIPRRWYHAGVFRLFLAVSWLQWLFRRLGFAPVDTARGPVHAVPAALRRCVNSKPSDWTVSSNRRPDGTTDRVAILQGGGGDFGGLGRLMIRVTRDGGGGADWGAPVVANVPGLVADEGRWANMAWDAPGKHLAVATLTQVFVLRVHSTGQCTVRGTFGRLGKGGIAGVALATGARGHSVFVLMYDGRLLRFALAAGVSGGIYERPEDVLELGNRLPHPTCLAYHEQASLLAVGGADADGDRGATVLVAVDSEDHSLAVQWSSVRQVSATHEGPVASDGPVWKLAFDESGARLLAGLSGGTSVWMLDASEASPGWGARLFLVWIGSDRTGSGWNEWSHCSRAQQCVGSVVESQASLWSHQSGAQGAFLCTRCYQTAWR